MKCLYCDKEGLYIKYCSRSCSAKANNSKFPKRSKISWELVNCLNCNTDFEYQTSKNVGKFCSVKCRGTYKYKTESIPKILQGIYVSPNTVKRYLTETTGYHCQLCDNKGIHNQKELVLQLDHIDGNSDNNQLNNLRLLCPNCHSQTETFSKRNKKETKRNRYLRKFKGY